MILTFFVILNVVVLFLFFKWQKINIHRLEVLIIWLISTMFFQNYSAFFNMNYKYFKIPEVLSLELAHLLNRTILIPVITIIFLNRFIILRHLRNKIALFFCTMLLLAGIEGLADFTGVLIHTNWKIWWSLLFWVIYLLILILCMSLFRKQLLKEVPRS